MRGAARRRLALGLGGLALLAAPTGWLVSDHLERNDAFCVSCHLRDGSPLHRGKREGFERRPAASLAAAHGVAGVRGRSDPALRCIDCHGGTGLAGRARVKLLSAKDAFWYATGRFEEPERMRWPLWDEDCRKCHADLGEGGAAPGAAPAFHALAVHNAELGVDCVACHLAHDESALPDHHFLVPDVVRARCAECHPRFAP
jgi:nitrate/TMAO reductase-like tetraheme cytochrome c subunit